MCRRPSILKIINAHLTPSVALTTSNTMKLSHSSFRVFFVAAFASTLSLLPISRAQTESAKGGPTIREAGTISGIVRNSGTATQLRLANIAIAGSGNNVVTMDDGSYTVSLPPGNYRITASYTGLDSETAEVIVRSGETVRQDFNLNSDIYKLDRFVVRTVREDDALALQQQRFASGLKTVVATNAFGAPADNPGELLQRMPGITASYAQGEVDSITIRGMGQGMAKLTVDGLSAATSFGNLLATGREFIVTELATNNLSQLELIKAPTPDQDGDSIAGTINLVTKRYFDQPGRTATLNLAVSGIIRDADAAPTDGTLGHHARASLSHTDSYGVFGGSKNLGISFDAAWSRVLRVGANTGAQLAGGLPAAYINFDGNNPIPRLFAAGEFGGSIKKTNANIGVDYKIGRSGFLFFKAGITNQDRDITRWIASTVGTPTTAAGFTADSNLTKATTATATSGLATQTLNSLRTSNISTFSGGGEFDLTDRTRLTTSASYSHAESKNPHFLQLNALDSGVAFQLDATGRNEFSPQLIQTGGPSWSDPANYRVTTLSSTITDGAPTDNYSLKADLTQHFDTRWPIYLKAGIKYTANLTSDLRKYESLTYVGADRQPNTADDSMIPFGGYVFRIGDQRYGSFAFMPRVNTKDDVPGAQQGYWTKTAAQAYGDLTNANARRTDVEEEMKAAYVMGNMKVGAVRLLGGLRFERTDQDVRAWLRNASVANGTSSVGGASIDPVVVATNIDRASRSYVGKVQRRSSYDEVFPGMHLVWEPKDGLLVRGSYNRSIARPSMSAILPNISVNDDTRSLTVGNSDLKPYFSHNYELSVERYFEPVGLISAGVFRKDIGNYFRSFSDVVGTEGLDGAGTYAGYTRSTSRNIGNAKVNGAEVALQQQFRWLPGIWKGLGAFANFTYLKTKGDFGTTIVTTRLPNMTPRTLNLGVSYVGHGWQIRPMLNWIDRTYRGSSGVVNYDSLARTWVDLKVQYTFSRRITAEVSIFNLTNEAESLLVSSGKRLPFVKIKPGTAYSFGVTGRF